MRETLPQVLDRHPAGAIVLSLYDNTVTYLNARAKVVFPGCAEDDRIEDIVRALELDTGVDIGWEAGSTRALMANADEWVIHFSRAEGGMWMIATRMPDIAEYPPSAILTLHAAAGDDLAQMGAVQVHINMALAARLAVLLDESARDMRMAQALVTQAGERIHSLRSNLVTSMSEFANPAPTQIIQAIPRSA